MGISALIYYVIYCYFKVPNSSNSDSAELACLGGLGLPWGFKKPAQNSSAAYSDWWSCFIWPIRSAIATSVGPAFKHTSQVQATRAKEATHDSWCSNPLAFSSKKPKRLWFMTWIGHHLVKSAQQLTSELSFSWDSDHASILLI